ncbi:hypothetical protein [Ruegeria sp. HKCCD7255]|uniref:hypothetical protein n=1 Tax=Ruegeria sp. HKCCD7255 TaxID=2683004 RepID=UPI001488B911|nr:hypothetical protein [Ruegeria sp. HKCCD7255]
MVINTGQLWAVEATHEAPALFVKICRLDESTQQGVQSGKIVGVSLIPQDEQTDYPSLSHAPIHEHSLGLSESKLIADDIAPDEDFDEGYTIWLEAYQDGKAGAFSLSPSQVYHLVTSVAHDGQNSD